jgi:hypothetical protein
MEAAGFDEINRIKIDWIKFEQKYRIYFVKIKYPTYPTTKYKVLAKYCRRKINVIF